MRITKSGSSPKARVLMMGLSGLVLMSKTGWERMEKPSARHSLAMATDVAMGKGAHADNLIKGIAALVGGGGGGRPNMAQAGGKNPAGIDAAVKEAVSVLEGQIA